MSTNLKLRRCLDVIQETYTNTSDYAEAMANFLEAKISVLNNHMQILTDILFATDAQGRYYNIQQYINDNRARLSLPTSSTVTPAGTFRPIAPNTNVDSDVVELSTDSLPLGIQQKIDQLAPQSVAVDGKLTCYSEIIMAGAQNRDGVLSEYSLSIDSSTGERASLNEILSFNRSKVSDLVAYSKTLRALSREAKLSESSSSEVGVTATSFSDVVSGVKEELGSNADSLSAGTLSVLGGLVVGSGTIMDKVKAISGVFTSMGEEAQQRTDDTTGFVPTEFVLGNYATTNAATAFADANPTLFTAAVNGVASVFITAGVAAFKLLQLGARLVKQGYEKYIAPIFANPAIKQQSGYESECCDFPCFTGRMRIDDIGTFEQLYVYGFSSSPNMPGRLNYALNDWFGMSDEELLSFLQSQIPSNMAWLIPTVFGDLYVYQVDDGSHKYAYFSLYLAPTDPLPIVTYYSWPFKHSVSYPQVHDWTDVTTFKAFAVYDWPSAVTSGPCQDSYGYMTEAIEDLFGYNWDSESISPIKSVDFSGSTSEADQLLLGFKSSLIRWSVYMGLRCLVNSTDFDYDNYISYDLRSWGTQLDWHYSSSLSVNWFARMWEMIGRIGFPTVHIRTDGNDNYPASYIECELCVAGCATRIKWYPGNDPYLTSSAAWRSVMNSKVTSSGVSTHIPSLGGSCLLADPTALYSDRTSAFINNCMVGSPDYDNLVTSQSWTGWDGYITVDGTVNSSPLWYAFLFGILSNKKDVMLYLFENGYDFPEFLPYIEVAAVRKPKWHAVTRAEMMKKAALLKDALFTVLTLIAVAATVTTLKVVIKKKGVKKLTALAASSEAMRYEYEAILQAYNSGALYSDFGYKRIPTHTDVIGDLVLPNGSANSDPANPDGLSKWPLERQHDIEQCYKSGKLYDFSGIDDAVYSMYIYKEDVANYKNLYAKKAKMSNLTSKLTTKLTGATEDLAGYVDNSTAEEEDSLPPSFDISDIYELIKGTR